MADDRVIDRIRRMRDRARDEATTESEAVFLAQRIQRMLEEHGITEADIGEADSGYVTDERHVKYLCAWRRMLAHQVGLLVGCSLTWQRELMSYHGRPLLCASAWELFLHLERACVTIPRARFPGDQRSARRAEKGVAAGLCVRLHDIRLSMPESRLPVVQEHANAAAWSNEKLSPRGREVDLEIDTPEAAAGYMLAGSVQIQDSVD